MADKLRIVGGRGRGAEHELREERVLVGSDPGCAVVLADDGVLGRHAVLERRNGTWTLRALDTGRPIAAAGRLVQEMRLEHGATFSLGEAELRFMTARALIDAQPLSGRSFKDPEKAVERLAHARARVAAQIGRVIVGQAEVLDQVLVALFARGHCILVGVPGLAKTLLVRTLAGTLDLDFRRVQFTPDLMPADVTGTDILEEDAATRRRGFRFARGPVFTNILLADEINRTPPKTQAALLEAMQERRVTASGHTHDLPQPFLVLATQNPIEQEGTYPLPEAQLDRFMFSIHVAYPSEEEEQRILRETTRDLRWEVDRVLDAASVIQCQHLVRQVPVSDHVALYAARLVRASRPGDPGAPEFVNQWVRWGAGPRAGQYLLLAAKAHVILAGRFSVGCEDVRTYALPVLRHRIFCNFAAASEGVSTDQIVTRLVEAVPEPTY